MDTSWPTLPLDDAYAHGVMKLTGESPLLMNNPRQTKRGERPPDDPKAAARRACYWTADGSSLCLWESHVKGAIRKAAKAGGYTVDGRRSLWPILGGYLKIQPQEIPLGTKNFDVDERPANVRGDQIMRARALVMPWSVTFDVYAYTKLLSRVFLATTFKEIVESAGVGIGLLDYSPRNGGPFGTFRVTAWDLR